MPDPIELQTNEATAQLSLTAGNQYVWRVGYYDGSNVTYTDWSEEFTSVAPMNGTIQSGQDIDIGTGKILYSNVYQTLADLPDAASYHGMFAHVHNADGLGTGAAFYAHAGNWVRLADNDDVPTTFVSGLNGLTGSIILAGGSNVQIGQSGNQLTISSTQTFSTLNGESGSLSLVGGDGIAVSTVDNIITVTATDHTSVNNVTGSVGIVAGENINVTTSGQNVVISGQSGGVSWGNPPTDPGDPGNPGDVAYDDNYLYVHTSQGWRRVTLGSWNPTITLTIQPQDLSLGLGQSGNFTVAATVSDGSSPSYQWQNSDDNGSTWDTITGANTTTYSLSGVSIADNGTQYRAVVSAPGAVDVTSSVATLTVGETFDLLVENGDRLMTEGGVSLDHDGTGGGVGPNPSGLWEEVLPQLDTLGRKFAYSPDSDTAYLLVNTTSSGGSSVIGVQKYERDAQNGAWVSASNAKNTGYRFLETVPSVAASKDGSRVIVANEKATPTDDADYYFAGFTVYEEQNGMMATVYSGSQDTFSQVAISGDGNVFAAYDYDYSYLKVFDVSGLIGSPFTGVNPQWLTLNNDGTRIAFSQYGDATGDGNTDSFSRAYLWTGSSWVKLGSDFISPANVLGGQPRQPLAFNDAGTRIAVGYSTATGNFTESGIVRVYDWDGSTWQQVGGDISGEAAYDLFGSAVALSESGSRLIVGARGHDSAAGNAGRSYIYEWSGSTWAAVGTPIDGDATTNIYFGDTAHISSDGTRVAASAPGADNGNGTLSVYELQNNQITITQQPQNVTYSGSPVVFSTAATVSDNSSPSYLWQSSADNGSTWANLSGETSSNLTVSSITPSDGGNQYRAVISAARAPDATTDAATLTVNENVLFSQQPQNTTVVAGNGATFSATLTPADNWYVYDMKWERADSGSPNSWNVVGTEDIANYDISSSSAVTQNYTWPSASSFDDGDLFRATGAAFENELIQTSPTPAGVVIPQQGEVAWLFGLISTTLSTPSSAYWSAAVNGTLVVTCQSRTDPSEYLLVNLYINGISVGSFQGYGPVSSSAFQVSLGDQVEVAVAANGISWYPRISMQFTPTAGLQTQSVTSATATLTVT